MNDEQCISTTIQYSNQWVAPLCLVKKILKHAGELRIFAFNREEEYRVPRLSQDVRGTQVCSVFFLPCTCTAPWAMLSLPRKIWSASITRDAARVPCVAEPYQYLIVHLQNYPWIISRYPVPTTIVPISTPNLTSIIWSRFRFRRLSKVPSGFETKGFSRSEGRQ